MYGIFTYIWVIFRANVGKYSIHGASGKSADSAIYGYGSKLGTPKLWMVNTKLDISICGPTSVFHFDPSPYVL